MGKVGDVRASVRVAHVRAHVRTAVYVTEESRISHTAKRDRDNSTAGGELQLMRSRGVV